MSAELAAMQAQRDAWRALAVEIVESLRDDIDRYGEVVMNREKIESLEQRISVIDKTRKAGRNRR